MDYYGMLIALTVELMSIVMVLIRRSSTLPHMKKVNFLTGAGFIIISACCECAGYYLDGTDTPRMLHSAFKFVELSVTPVIPVICGCAVMPLKDKRIPILLLSAHMIIEFMSMWLGITFYVNDMNVYEHCSLYWIYYIAYFSSIVFMIYRVSVFSHKYQNHNMLSLMLIMVFVLSGVLSQLVNDKIRIVWMTCAIAFTLFWTYYCEMVNQVDVLTELINRTCFENSIRAMRSKAMIVFFDVDNFKSINDRYGHLYGDKCLNTVGRALKKAYGKGGVCYRIGGDEFCVIMTRRLSSTDECGKRFCSILDEARKTDEKLPHVSYGYAEFDPHSMITSDAITAADQMMYRIKKAHKQGAALTDDECA